MLSGVVVLVNAFFPARAQRYAATDRGNRFAQDLIVELGFFMVSVVVDRPVCANAEVLCRFNRVNIGAKEQEG